MHNLALSKDKLIGEYEEAKNAGIITKPVVIGPFTFLKLANYNGKKQLSDFVPEIRAAYEELFGELNKAGVEWVQIDEPYLVTDLSAEDVALFVSLYTDILKSKGKVKVLLQTYFGDVRDCYEELTGLPFDGLGLDFLEGKQTLALLEKYGFPAMPS